MNIFENYLSKINRIIKDNKDILKLRDLTNLSNVNFEVPPEKFNFELSTNVALVLSKANNKSPTDLAVNLSEAIKKSDNLIDNISIIKPGFIN